MDVGGAEHPRRLEGTEQAIGQIGDAGITGGGPVGCRTGGHGRVPRVVEPVGELHHQLWRRGPREDAARLPAGQRGRGAAHPPDVEVEHAAEMGGRVVTGQPPSQVAVQRDSVQQGLQRVVRAEHRARQPGGRIVGGGELAGAGCRRTQPVGLVVDDDEARRAVGARHPQHDVEAAGEEPTQRLIAQHGITEPGPVRQQRVGRLPAGQVPGDQRPECAEAQVTTRPVAARDRQLEAELGQPVTRRDVTQPQPVEVAARTPRAASRRPPSMLR